MELDDLVNLTKLNYRYLLTLIKQSMYNNKVSQQKQMAYSLTIGQKSIQIAQDFLPSIQNPTSLIYSSSKKQDIDSKDLIEFIIKTAVDDSLSLQTRVQKIKEQLEIPVKFDIQLANSEYIKSGDVEMSRKKERLLGQERGVILEQSLVVDSKEEKKIKIKVYKEQKQEQFIDSMFYDSIFNQIEFVNKPNPKENANKIVSQRFKQNKEYNSSIKDQMQKLVRQNTKLKNQLIQLKKVIFSFENFSKISSDQTIEKKSTLRIIKILSQSILSNRFIEESKIKNQPMKVERLNQGEILHLLQQKDKIIKDKMVLSEKIKEQFQETYKKRIKKYQSKIQTLKNRIQNPSGASLKDILNYLHHSFSKINEKSAKSECANMIITFVSAYINT